MEKEGCGANIHSHPSVHVSLAVKMPFPAWEFCLMPPLLPCSLSPLRGDAKSSGQLQYRIALPLFFLDRSRLGSKSPLFFVFYVKCPLCGNSGFLNLLTLGPCAVLTGVGFFSPWSSILLPCPPKGGQLKGIGCKSLRCTLVSTGKSKKEDSAKEEKRKRDVPAQLLKSAKPTQGSKSQQLLQTQQPSAPQSQQGGFSAHKEIKLTLLNKVRGRVGAVPPCWGSEERMRWILRLRAGGKGAPGSVPSG